MSRISERFKTYSMFLLQHYVIKFVSDLRQVGGFLQVFWFPPQIKLIATIYIAEILLKVALITLNQTKPNHQTCP
jgi:hypothetical protein